MSDWVRASIYYEDCQALAERHGGHFQVFVEEPYHDLVIFGWKYTEDGYTQLMMRESTRRKDPLVDFTAMLKQALVSLNFLQARGL